MAGKHKKQTPRKVHQDGCTGGWKTIRPKGKSPKSTTYVVHDAHGHIIPEAYAPAAAPYGRAPLPPHPAICGYGGGVQKCIHQIKAGLPVACFDELRESLECSQESLAAVAGIPGRTLARRRQEGRFRPDEGERVLRLIRVFEAVLGLFEGDSAAARRWLKTPQELFEGRSPLEYCDTEPGASFVREVAGRLEHGVFS